MTSLLIGRGASPGYLLSRGEPKSWDNLARIELGSFAGAHKSARTQPESDLHFVAYAVTNGKVRR